MTLIPKNWSSFQHYRDRSPPWVKLHKGLLDDREFQRLPLASRALAPMLWLLASERTDGAFNGAVDELCFRLRASDDEIRSGLQPLIDAGFFLETTQGKDTDASPSKDSKSMLAPRERPDSATLAACQHSATPEERRGETKKETEIEKRSPRKPRAASLEITLSEYLAICKTECKKPVPEDHPIRAYCKDAGITDEMRQIAWLVFKDRNQTNPKAKKYIDWPAAFANSIKDRWYRLWNVNAEGHADWSPTGLQEKRVIETRMNDTKDPQHAPA